MSPAVTAFVLTLIAGMEVMVSEDEEIRMPHDLPALSPSEIDRIRLWIAEGGSNRSEQLAHRRKECFFCQHGSSGKDRQRHDNM